MKLCEFFPNGATCHPSVFVYNGISFLKTRAPVQLFQMLVAMSWFPPLFSYDKWKRFQVAFCPPPDIGLCVSKAPQCVQSAKVCPKKAAAEPGVSA